MLRKDFFYLLRIKYRKAVAFLLFIEAVIGDHLMSMNYATLFDCKSLFVAKSLRVINMKLITFKELRTILVPLSEPTIRRYLRESRAGKSTFPLPVTSPGKKGLWIRKDVEDWIESPKSVEQIETPAQRTRRLKVVHNQLRELDVKMK